MSNPSKIGTEFQVNTETANDQRDASVTGLSGGGFIVTWQSDAQDGDSFGVYGQRYNSDGTRAGSEFKINSFTTNTQGDIAITALTNGGFVVTWESFEQEAVGSDYGIYGQRFNGDGSPAGVEFLINSQITDYQLDPSVAALAGGGFVVTWASYNQDAGGGKYGIFGQRYNEDGTRSGIEFQVNTYVADNQNETAVATLAAGGFVVTWNSEGQDGGTYGIYGQRFKADGTKNGVEFKINTFTTSDQYFPSITELAGGGFVVTWESYGQDGGGTSYGIFAQRYNGDGTRDGTEFLVNTHTADNQLNPLVTSLADGGFVITWDSYDQDAGGTDDGIYGQRFNGDGSKNGTEFQINSETANDQEYPSISVLATGNIVVIWESKDQDAGGTDDGVFGQLFSIDLFSAGDDTVYLPAIGPSGGWQALAGDDRVTGGDSDDNVDGGAGADYVTSGNGADSVDGGDGSDWLYGQGGDDTINAGAGAMDVSLGDDGNDTINGEGGMDYMYGYAGNDTAHGGDGDDVAYGGAGNDELYGDDGADWLFGEAGDDKLFGGAGADILMGGAGTDEITGGKGNDWMWGGDMAGAGDGVKDTFFFGASWGGDVIWDFEDGKDILDVSGAGITSFASLTVGTFGQFTTIISASGDIIYLRGAGDVAVAESAITGADFIFT